MPTLCCKQDRTGAASAPAAAGRMQRQEIARFAPGEGRAAAVAGEPAKSCGGGVMSQSSIGAYSSSQTRRHEKCGCGNAALCRQRMKVRGIR